ncbi:MAG: DUF2528 family protein [Balneolales bacterium]|nr:DUF2528 family protein [Balneolales bacterium]
MIKKFHCNYDMYEANVLLEVDTDKFTPEVANEVLTFWTWDYDKENDPVEECLKKICLEVIRVATANNYNEHGVISDFENKEGWYRLNGEDGVKLMRVDAYEFSEDKCKFSF